VVFFGTVANAPTPLQNDTERSFSWRETGQVPEVTGIYAWYAPMEIGSADVNAAIESMTAAKLESTRRAGEKYRRRFKTIYFHVNWNAD
jgi:hypothetical protein